MKIIKPSKPPNNTQRSSNQASVASKPCGSQCKVKQADSSELDIFDDDDSWSKNEGSKSKAYQKKYRNSNNSVPKTRESWQARKPSISKQVQAAGLACVEKEPKYQEEAPLVPGKKRRRSELTNADAGATQTTLLIDPSQKEFSEVLARGIRLLAMREHSVKEMHEKLSSKTESIDQVHAVIDELLAKKYLSDERFAESYVRSRANRGFGPVKIRSELKAKGIGSDLIQDYLQTNSSIWFDNAVSQYQKKFGESRVADYKDWTKRARFLQSRGFTSEQIQVTVPVFSVD